MIRAVGGQRGGARGWRLGPGLGEATGRREVGAEPGTDVRGGKDWDAQLWCVLGTEKELEGLQWGSFRAGRGQSPYECLYQGN
jgi:hypothetical protein